MVKPRSTLKPPRWWGGRGCPPAAWSVAVADFTQGETASEWGLAASLFVMHYRRRRSVGPTFREVMEHLLPETGGVPSPALAEWPPSERMRAVHRFRYFVLTKWQRDGYIDFDDGVTRSLRTGPRFQELASRKSYVRALVSKKPPRSGRGSHKAAISASFTPSAAADRLHISRTSLHRLTAAGYLRLVDVADQALYPAWQFSERFDKPVVAGIDVVAPSVPYTWSISAEHFFMAAPRHELTIEGRHRSPSEWLDLGENPHVVAGILEKYSYEIGS